MKKMMASVLLLAAFTTQAQTFTVSCESQDLAYLNKMSLEASVTLSGSDSTTLNVSSLALTPAGYDAETFEVAPFNTNGTFTIYPSDVFGGEMTSLVYLVDGNEEVAFIRMNIGLNTPMNSEIRLKDGYTYHGKCLKK